jgi:hypothetical protein
MKKYIVTLTVTDDCGYSDTDTTTIYIKGEGDPPTVVLAYPQGGEILKGNVKVKWWAFDTQNEYDMPIYLYYNDPSNQINGILENTGEYTWDTTTLPDGTYTLIIAAYDHDNNAGGDESEPFQIKNHESQENHAPNKPNKPTGSTTTKVGEEYTYSSSTNDPDGDQIWYKWDWDDGTDTGWLGPYNSGETCEASHIWEEKDDYSIRVKAKDEHGKESAWSDSLVVSMPKIRTMYKPVLEQIVDLLIERFPILTKLFTVFLNI